MIGKPKYKVDDLVKIEVFLEEGGEAVELTGKVYIVDAYGTFEQHEEPSYDIMVEDFGGSPCLFKHWRESSVEKV